VGASERMRSASMQSSEGSGARGAVGQGTPLRDLAEEALRCALRSGARSGANHGADHGADGELRQVLGRLCERASANGLQAEQLLIVIKAGWRELPEARHLPSRRAGETLARVVTLCIREYYATRRGE